jgi:hypothetical protein
MEFIKRFIRCLLFEIKKEFKLKLSHDIWCRLAIANEIDLICLLRKVETREKGYSTIIIPDNGFTKDKELNDMIIQWLKSQNVNTPPYNSKQEVKELTESLNR